MAFERSERYAFPPMDLRRIVGPLEDADYDNPSGEYIWGDLAYPPLKAGVAYRRVFDFGCGCGRNARQLLLQEEAPEKLVGVDVSRRLIEWCQENLRRDGVSFHHHDVYQITYAPENTRNEVLPIRHYGSDFTLVNAHSVFTHLLERETRYYLSQMCNMLAEHALLRTTWFFFNKQWFPVLAPFQHCLYVNTEDPTQAVYYDWNFFVELVRELGFKLLDVVWTSTSGYQNIVMLGWGSGFEDRSAAISPPDTVLGFGTSAPTNTEGGYHPVPE